MLFLPFLLSFFWTVFTTTAVSPREKQKRPDFLPRKQLHNRGGARTVNTWLCEKGKKTRAWVWPAYVPLPVYLGCHIHTLLLVIRYWGTSGLGKAKEQLGPPLPGYTYIWLTNADQELKSKWLNWVSLHPIACSHWIESVPVVLTLFVIGELNYDPKT